MSLTRFHGSKTSAILCSRDCASGLTRLHTSDCKALFDYQAGGYWHSLRRADKDQARQAN